MLVSLHDDPPILICADLQVEYLTQGRRHVIHDGDAAISRCLELLTLWRSNLWPVMHLKRIAQAAWFNPASKLTDWIAELKPRPGELTFDHPLPSAYSSSRFADYMSNIVKDWHKTGYIIELEKKYHIKATKFAQEMHDKYSK